MSILLYLSIYFFAADPMVYAISDGVATHAPGLITMGIFKDMGWTTSNTFTGSLIYSNSIGRLNTVKITDVSGSLSYSGAAITVAAWDVSGNQIPESGGAAPLTLSNNGTTTIAGVDLAARFPTGVPASYALSAATSSYIITNVKSSTDGAIFIPNIYTNGTTNFVANSIGRLSTVKITDVSGSLSTAGVSVAVTARDAGGNAVPESTSFAALRLYNHGTTIITGVDLAARFPSGTPASYEFTVDSPKYVIANVKSSADGSIYIPCVYTNGTASFVANSIGLRSTIKISDVSGALAASGATIAVSAWDVNGIAISESTNAEALKLYSRGTTSITGPALAARFPSGTPASYEFTVGSAKYIITNIRSSADGTTKVPTVYTSGTTTYVSNNISARSTIKITDASGSLTSSGVAITVSAWDVDGNIIPESGSAAPLRLYNNGTTLIAGADLMARFPTGTSVLYEFAIGSSKYIVTNVTVNDTGTLNIPSVYSSGVAGVI